MYFEVLDVLSNELSQRFHQKNGLLVAAVLEKLLLDAVNGAMSNTADFPDELNTYYSKDIELSHLKPELAMLPDLLSTHNQKNSAISTVTNVRTIAELMNSVSNSKSFFREVVKLIRIYFTLPVTTATAERTFSALRRLKTHLRSTMSQISLNNAMLLNVHKERTDRIDLLQVARDFVSVNDRRKHFFGTF